MDRMKPDYTATGLRPEQDSVESKQITDRSEQVHYQLYKLLAFAIQELSYFASAQKISDALSLPKPVHTLSNRAQMAVDRIEKQNPHFFAGYIKYRRGMPYPPIEDGRDTDTHG